MPLYLFKHPKKEEFIEVFFHMNDEKFFSKEGVDWERVFTKPNAAIDTQINPFSESEFKEKMGRKKGGTVGELWDEAKICSEKRQKTEGIDKIKEKTIKSYQKKTDKAHPLAKERPKSYTITKAPKFR